MLLLMRILERFGTTPEASAVNIIRALTAHSAILWSITSGIAANRDVVLP
jgi:hypothetical protein